MHRERNPLLPLNSRKKIAKMKLPIAIGVLFLVLVANTEAQEQEPTLKERFESFGNQMKSFADGVSEKTKSIVEDIHNSEIATQARTWLQNMKTKLEEKFKSQ